LAFFMQVGASLVAVILNLQLVRYQGDFGVGAFGIINSVLMVVMGIGQGMQPIAGFNYGARRFGRVVRVLHHAIVGASLVTCAGFLVSELLPWPVVCAFTRDPHLRSLSVQVERLFLRLRSQRECRYDHASLSQRHRDGRDLPSSRRRLRPSSRFSR
jgi:Na+-driven multidrug efflux pump